MIGSLALIVVGVVVTCYGFYLKGWEAAERQRDGEI